MRLTLSDKGLLIVAVPLCLELAFLLVLSYLTYVADDQSKRLDHYKNLIATADSITKSFYDATNALFTAATTRDEEAPRRYDELTWEIHLKLEALRNAVADKPQYRKALSRVLIVANDCQTMLDETRAQLNEGPGLALVRGGLKLPHHIISTIGQLVTELQRFVEELQQAEKITPERTQSLRATVQICLALGCLVTVAFIMTAVIFYRRMTKRLVVLMDNTGRLVRDEPLHPVLSGSDEIATLDNVFHEMAATLAEANFKRAELEKVKQQFVAMLSHDLRTPLSSLQTYLGVLEMGAYGNLNERGVAGTRVAATSVKRLIGMVSDLLEIDRMEAGILELKCEETPLQPLFDQAIEAVGSFAEQQGVELSVVQTNLIVYADPESIVRVLVNLLGNAVKFSPAESTVEVQTHASGGLVEVRVSDRGRGIPESQKEKIFNRFHQVEADDSRAKGGAGLGLAICKAIVEAHGGTIGVESSEGQGSTFWFRLNEKRPA